MQRRQGSSPWCANGSVQMGGRSQVVSSFASGSSSRNSSRSGSNVADLAGLCVAWINLLLGFFYRRLSTSRWL